VNEPTGAPARVVLGQTALAAVYESCDGDLYAAFDEAPFPRECAGGGVHDFAYPEDGHSRCRKCLCTVGLSGRPVMAGGQLGFEVDSVYSGAVLSACEHHGAECTEVGDDHPRPYRYELVRRWRDGPVLEFVMLNPSTADATKNDPTIGRCMGFAQQWGFHGIRVTNLFALRATNPQRLFEVGDPVGPDNSRYLGREDGPVTVCAWGAHRAPTGLRESSCYLLAGRSELMCLGYNIDGSPKHPLYVPKNVPLQPYKLVSTRTGENGG
jgi:hypothetical protein